MPSSVRGATGLVRVVVMYYSTVHYIKLQRKHSATEQFYKNHINNILEQLNGQHWTRRWSKLRYTLIMYTNKPEIKMFFPDVPRWTLNLGWTWNVERTSYSKQVQSMHFHEIFVGHHCFYIPIFPSRIETRRSYHQTNKEDHWFDSCMVLLARAILSLTSGGPCSCPCSCSWNWID